MSGWRPRAPMNNHGFTLVETILALIVLGIALVPLINFFAHAGERDPLPQDVVAAGLAAARMEELLANRALQGWETFPVPTSLAPANWVDVDTTNFPNYQWKAEVVKVSQNDFNQTLGAGGNTRYKRITVYVKKPNLQVLNLVSIVTDY